jgi:carboxypeptidase C (cathepsin A)
MKMPPTCAMALWLAIISCWIVAPISAVRILPDAERIAANQVLSSLVDGNNNVYNNNADNRRLQPVPQPGNPDDHLVTHLPLMAEGTLNTPHWAGLLPASPKNDKYLFYWLFAPDMTSSQNLQDRDVPLVIWLNGG